MLDALVALMEAADGRCELAEARWVSMREERLGTRLGVVEQVHMHTSEGVGVRVRIGGAWGFAATRSLDRKSLEATLGRAIDIASAQPARNGVVLAPIAPARGHWESAYERDPFKVSLEEKLELLLAADEALRGDPRIVRSAARALGVRTEKAFASTEGAACTQLLIETGAGISAVASDGNELQIRGYPSAHGGGHTAAAGWEHAVASDLVGNAPRVAAEALELLSAPPCPASDDATLILHGEQLALQVHESIGHALELDRILGGEASYAGTSWVGADGFGSLRYGSERLNVTADATLPAALGSFGWDDEGVPSASTPLIRDGVLVGALASRESATEIGLELAAGCMRADGFARQPIVRMTNVSIDPGDAGSLDDLIAATDAGLYLETNRSWSIDDRRLHFQFGCEIAREINGGKLGRLFRNSVYAGITPRFWGGLDAVCSESDWKLWGLTDCGKGEPGQVAHVSHGTAPARFRGVRVGAA